MKICSNWAYRECFKGESCEFYHVPEVREAIEVTLKYLSDGQKIDFKDTSRILFKGTNDKYE